MNARRLAPRPLALAAASLVLWKLAALLAVGPGAEPEALWRAFGSSWQWDGVVLGALALGSRGWSARVARPLAVGVGLYTLANLYALWLVGRPLEVAMLVYARDATLGLATSAPGALVGAGVLVLIGAAAGWRALRVPEQAPSAKLAGALLAGCVLGLVALPDPEPEVDALARNPPGALAASWMRWARSEAALGALAGGATRASLELEAPGPGFTDAVGWRPDAPRPRHVVLWIAEGEGTGALSLYGAPEPTSPNLERLATHAVRFERFYAAAPISIKAIFSILCGLYPSPESALETRFRPRIACPSLMETLRARGYAAGLFHGGIFGFTDKLSLLGGRGFEIMLDAESIPDADRYFQNGWGIDDQALLDHALRWLDGRAEPDAPTLAVFLPIIPHFPYFLPPGAPRPIPGSGRRADYLNGVAYTDRLFGALHDAYAQRGLADDTLFVFVGDHGQAFFEHPGNKLHGLALYEENVRAPLVLVNRRLFHGQTSGRLGDHPDVLPTLLDALGIPIPAGLQGQSLLAEGFRYQPAIFATHFQRPLVGLRDGAWKYIWDEGRRQDELYDLESDPQEQHNLAARHPHRAARYREALRAHVVAQRRFVRGHPVLDESYQRGMLRAARVEVVRADGTRGACDLRGEAADPPSFGCPQDARASVRTLRVFNIERECVAVDLPRQGGLRITFALQGAPPPRLIGAGLPDVGLRRSAAPLHVRWSFSGVSGVSGVSDGATLEQRIDGRPPFRALPLEDPPRGGTLAVEVRSEQPTACLTLAP